MLICASNPTAGVEFIFCVFPSHLMTATDQLAAGVIECVSAFVFRGGFCAGFGVLKGYVGARRV
jgi:hypothetical protein